MTLSCAVLNSGMEQLKLLLSECAG